MASVSADGAVEKPLYTDAGSGLIFNLKGRVILANSALEEGVLSSPVCKQASIIRMPAGSRLLGIRFQPGVGRRVLGDYYQRAPTLVSDADLGLNLNGLYDQLKRNPHSANQIALLYHWAENLFDVETELPSALTHTLTCVKKGLVSSHLHAMVGQRQLERQFNGWLGMTPKYYQRIVRVRQAIDYLKQHQPMRLAEVALECGFCDQAHMTREFRHLAGRTPRQVLGGSGQSSHRNKQ